MRKTEFGDEAERVRPPGGVPPRLHLPGAVLVHERAEAGDRRQGTLPPRDALGHRQGITKNFGYSDTGYSDNRL